MDQFIRSTASAGRRSLEALVANLMGMLLVGEVTSAIIESASSSEHRVTDLR